LTRFSTQIGEKHGERNGGVIQTEDGEGEGTTERGETEMEEWRDQRTWDWNH
jgi:hypothetical protein